jgi:hypothetical protein
MINVAQGIHLELWLGWTRLGLRVQRRGQLYATDITDVRVFPCIGGLRSKTASAEGPGERCVAHQGLVVAGAVVQGRRR